MSTYFYGHQDEKLFTNVIKALQHQVENNVYRQRQYVENKYHVEIFQEIILFINFLAKRRIFSKPPFG